MVDDAGRGMSPMTQGLAPWAGTAIWFSHGLAVSPLKRLLQNISCSSQKRLQPRPSSYREFDDFRGRRQGKVILNRLQVQMNRLLDVGHGLFPRLSVRFS